VSYSLYLIHFPLLYILISTLSGVIGEVAWSEHISALKYAIIVIEFAVAIVLSTISFQFIEEPGIRVGKKLGNRNI
jgi:peptidoglycan/LPS O-acetylase OafA/YrhL